LERSLDILRRYWGFNKFRPLQEEIADSAIYGHDTFALLPTGGGKSICFQVPGLSREGVTIVISPLIALMEDQVNNLRKKGIRAHSIHSNLKKREIDILLDNAVYNGVDFLYVSPERLQTRLFIERFKKMKPGLIVIDEAHCISEWGQDFRPAYLEIKNIREHHPETPMIALTATATEKVRTDIIEQLELKSPKIFEASFERQNIAYKVEACENKVNRILDYCKEKVGLCGIVYCSTRRSVKEVARMLHNNKVKVGIYHGGLSADDRTYMMNQWMKNDIQIMVATNAFGMGIDKPDVRFVLHYEMPDNLEAYFQEAGRAGRDGELAETIAFFTKTDIADQEAKLKQRFPEITELQHVFRAMCYKLQVAIGSGKDESYPVDLPQISKHFDIPIQKVYYALRAIEQNGNLIFSESVFQRTKVKISISNTELYSLQVSHEKLAPLLKVLVRSYPGIFTLFLEVHDKEICSRLKISERELKTQLELLEKMGVIDVHWQSNSPQVTFLEDRPADDKLPISKQDYIKRFKNAEARWKAVKKLLSEPLCRNVQLLSYFGQESESCGRCDICIRETMIMDIRAIQKNILLALHKPKSISELSSELQISNEDLKPYLHQYLLNEDILESDGKYLLPGNQ
jgi:ATP-dependent DNA helicase RecQ